MKKPIKEWYKELPQPFQLQANYNFDFHRKPICPEKTNSILSALRMFFWPETPEGESYWMDVDGIVMGSTELDANQIYNLHKLTEKYENKTSDEGEKENHLKPMFKEAGAKQKPIPRMVEVRDDGAGSWLKRELISDLSGMGLEMPFIVRGITNPKKSYPYEFMREIETKPMKFSEFCKDQFTQDPIQIYELDIIYESYQHYLGYFKNGGK